METLVQRTESTGEAITRQKMAKTRTLKCICNEIRSANIDYEGNDKRI